MTDTITDIREVRANAQHVIHRSPDTGTGRNRIPTVCGETIERTALYTRNWQGSGTPPDLSECPACFTQAEVPTREVRENADPVVHRTTAPGGRTEVDAVCGRHINWSATTARTWAGEPQRQVTECPDCFPPAAAFTPGCLVTAESYTGVSPRLPGDWTEGKVYVYVGPRPRNPEHSMVLVTDGWNVSAYSAEALPEIVQTAGLRDMPRLEAWNVVTTALRPAPADAQVTGRLGRARARLIDAYENTAPTADNPVQACIIHAHPATVHTHTVGGRPSWGNPSSQPSNVIREVHPVSGDYLLFAKGEHLVPSSGQPAVPTGPAIGTDLYPLQVAGLRTLHPGTVLTIYSRPRGEHRGTRLIFGCKEFEMSDLSAAKATVRYDVSGRITAECDVTLTTEMLRMEALTVAGKRISMAELSDYASSVIVKEHGAPLPPANSIVMEHGFYGCAHHAGEVIVLGNGHARDHDPTQPLLGVMRPVSGSSHALTGTIGVREGMLHTAFRDCTPIYSSTTAHTMRFATERQWSAVPATAAQIERYDAAQTDRSARGKAHFMSSNERTITRVTESGAPLAAADPSPF